MLDKVKALGYKYSTKASITVSIADMEIPEKKYEIIHETEQEVVKIDRQFKRGFITNDERYRLTVQQWEKSIKDVTDALQGNLKRFNPIFMMADSGARGSMNQIRQLAGMRGLMADTNGRTIEIPIKANFREGLSALEYFISSRGARKGLTDTALRTADSGYLTRRMVDVCQDVIIREFDCGSTNGSWKGDYYEKGQLIDSFANRIRGRYPVYDIVDEKTGELLHSKDVSSCEEDVQGACPSTAQQGLCPLGSRLQSPFRRVREVLRHEPCDKRAGQPRRGCRHHCRAVHRRAPAPS